MKKGLLVGALSVLMLSSCTNSSLSIKDQLYNDYNFKPLNVETHDYQDKYIDSLKSSFLVLSCDKTTRGEVIKSTGSGFIYKEYKPNCYYVITNKHVAPSNIHVYYVVSHTGQIIPATLMGTGGLSLDVAVLRVENVKDVQVANISLTDNYKTGDSIYSLGTPSSINLFGSISKGIISNDKRIVKETISKSLFSEEHAIQIDVSINPGNSGGPLYTEQGEVIGINTFAITQGDEQERLNSVNFSLPLHDVLIVADYIIKNYNGIVINFRPYDFDNITFQNVSSLSLGDKKKYDISYDLLDGVFVKLSRDINLPSYSVIKKVSDVSITDTFELRKELLKISKNDYIEMPKIKLTILDKGIEKETFVTLRK